MSDQTQIPDPQAPDPQNPGASVPLPPPGEAPRGRAGRGLRLALAVSVALNLAVVGLVAGMAWHGGPGGRGAMLRDLGFGPFETVLRPEDREAVRGMLRGQLGDILTARRQAARDLVAILAALRAEPFDPEALSQAMAAHSGHLGDRLQFGSTVLRDYLLTLDDPSRHALADRMEDHLRRGPGAAGPDQSHDTLPAP